MITVIITIIFLGVYDFIFVVRFRWQTTCIILELERRKEKEGKNVSAEKMEEKKGRKKARKKEMNEGKEVKEEEKKRRKERRT